MADDRERFDGALEEDENYVPSGMGPASVTEEVLFRPDTDSSTRLTVDEAAEELNMDHNMAAEMIRDGYLEGTPGGGETVVDIQDLRQFQDDVTQGAMPGSREVPHPRVMPPEGGDPSQAVS